MAKTRLDIRQSETRTLYSQIASASVIPLDSVIASINAELTPPGRLIASAPASLIVNIGSGTVTNPQTGRILSLPPINNLVPTFTGGTITFPSAHNGTITVSPGTNSILNCPTGQYVKVLVQLDQAGNISVVVGTPDAVLANALVPGGNTSFLSLGHITVRNIAGTVQNIANSAIAQFVGGGGTGGSGTGNELLETLKNQLIDSPFELMTPNIFRTDADDKIDPASTATYSLTTSNVTFASAGDALISTQSLDPTEFLGTGNGIGSVDLTVFWQAGAVDAAAIYEVSRDGGLEYQVIDMERVGLSTEVFRGVHVFEEEASQQIVSTYAVANASTSVDLDATNNKKLSQKFVLANDKVAKSVVVYTVKTGSPSGSLKASIYSNLSTSPDKILTQSLPVTMASISSGTSSVTVTLPATVLPAGTYHLVLEGDAAYQASYSNGVTELSIRADNTSPSIVDAKKYNGSAWSAITGTALVYELDGSALDLRVKITSSDADVALDGYGIFYDLTSSGISRGAVANREVQSFDGLADNESTFTLTSFLPDAGLLKVYEAETGQVYVWGAFALSGHDVIFPANTFNKPGKVTLIFDQNGANSFDNSDLNGALLAANSLGSTDASIDRSIAGRGIFLRRPDGTLREIALDNLDNLIVYSS